MSFVPRSVFVERAHGGRWEVQQRASGGDVWYRAEAADPSQWKPLSDYFGLKVVDTYGE